MYGLSCVWIEFCVSITLICLSNVEIKRSTKSSCVYCCPSVKKGCKKLLT
ncbi:hypothetical protein Sjap_024687 [Stephania japonica]|uniref:Uncharacterized protein n=1 Tax=Stephania japonica TaxID=461633 RepID=A0AAP0EDU9_9MAGN